MHVLLPADSHELRLREISMISPVAFRLMNYCKHHHFPRFYEKQRTWLFPFEQVMLTWRDSNAVAVNDRALLLLFLRRLDAVLLHVAHRLVPLPLPLSAGASTWQQLVSHIKQHVRGLCWGLGSAIEVI